MRFNAEKRCIGMYHSTKIWQFGMRHHCGSILTIQTDPKNTEYIVVEGGKKKVRASTDNCTVAAFLPTQPVLSPPQRSLNGVEQQKPHLRQQRPPTRIIQHHI